MKGRRHIGDGRELLIGETYKSILGAAPIAAALSSLAQLTESDKAFWGCFDVKQHAGFIVDSFNVRAEFVNEYNSGKSSENVWFARGQYFQVNGLIWRGSKILPMQDLMATDFYRQFLAPQEIYHTLHVVIEIDGDRIAHVMLTRPQHDPDFGESEIEIAQCFALHARRAVEARRATSELRLIQAGLTEVMEDAGLGVAILDPPAVIYASSTCERILGSLRTPGNGRNGGSVSSAGQIFFPRNVAEAIGAQKQAGATNLVLHRVDGGKVLVNVKSFVLGAGAVGRTGLVVTFLDLNQRVLVDQELLRSAYDLTASEARVCSLLANGESVENVSEKLRISPNTARTHIKRIFSKTGATRQAALVKLILSTAALQRSTRDGPTIGEPQ